MSERPKNGADQDATVMLPAGGLTGEPRGGPDPDATVMIPPRRDEPDADATVMMPAAPADDDATVMMPPRRAPETGVDPDATVMLPAGAGQEAAADADATVMMPAPPGEDPEATIAFAPGPRRDAEAMTPPPPPSAPDSPAAAADPASLGGLNPLVAPANPVLAVVAQIRQAFKHPDPAGLRENLLARIGEFEAAAVASGADADAVAEASRALCALIDESAASTPWGADWTGAGVLAARHGGMTAAEAAEAFFASLEARTADPAANRDLLEFLDVCLALGYEGRAAAAPPDREALADRRHRLLELIRAQRPSRDGELSGQWRGLQSPARRAPGAIGLWAAASAAALLLAALYAGLSISLGGLSDPVARELAQLRPAPAPERPIAAPTPKIAEQLAAEIARGEIAVTDSPGASRIVLRSDRLFASGSARLEPALEAVVMRVAEALERVPGTVVVTGHTDDVPIRTARFPSNWELSTERAASVVKLLAGKVSDAARLKAEGLADSMPAAPNDSAANRARNRRVEIQLRSAP